MRLPARHCSGSVASVTLEAPEGMAGVTPDVGSPFAETIKFRFSGRPGWPAFSFYRNCRIRQVAIRMTFILDPF
jgi:hypothetical protein